MKTGMRWLGALVMIVSVTGCQCGPGGFVGGGLAGGGNGGCGDGCASGNCGLLSGALARWKGRTCPDADGQMTPGYYAAAPGDAGGPLADQAGYHFRAHQSHMGAYPGPAMGAPSPTYTYPYYTTRGPRDFLAKQPTSIGY